MTALSEVKYMFHQQWYIAYRLEDNYNNSPYFYNGHKTILPDGYYHAYLNPCRYKEKEYSYSFYKYDLYEYFLKSTALVYDSGDVLFRKDDIISKTKLGCDSYDLQN